MLTIIGCGNPVRSDDGVGVFVARSLQACSTPGPVEWR
jgi:Ni,Fe-hydrogenase maturation factor